MWWKHDPSHFVLISFFSWGFWLKKRYGSGASDSVSDEPFSPTHILIPALFEAEGRAEGPDMILSSCVWGLGPKGWGLEEDLFSGEGSSVPPPCTFALGSEGTTVFLLDFPEDLVYISSSYAP